jgi:hypothetical protein
VRGGDLTVDLGRLEAGRRDAGAGVARSNCRSPIAA